nr:MAG TPA: hypothetical protein [Caudoviricetes sp.]
MAYKNYNSTVLFEKYRAKNKTSRLVLNIPYLTIK